MKLNAYLGILLAVGLMIGESIRSWGKNRNWFFIIDDFIFGAILLIGAILVLKKHSLRFPILFSGWASCFGMTYGSFFSKLTNSYEFESNIDNNILTFLVGLAFIGSFVGLIWSIILFSNNQKK